MNRYIVRIARDYEVEAYTADEAEDIALQLEYMGSAELPTVSVERILPPLKAVDSLT